MGEEKPIKEYYNTEELRLVQGHRTQRHKEFMEAQLVENKQDNRAVMFVAVCICYIFTVAFYFRWW